MARYEFPQDFVWGAATSAQQIEGGAREDGRGESVWDRFAAAEGRIADGSTPAVACDHYRRWRKDVDLMKSMGLGAYRFSIAWPRIFPRGGGKPNAPGLAFYDRLVDALLDAGIAPFPTLNHWDLPQALQDRGGWGERGTTSAFVEYALTVVDRLGDRVDRWTTHNEPWCIAVLGHGEGCHAPGHKDPAEALRVSHHLLLSHGMAAKAMRELRPGIEVGIVTMYVPASAATDSDADRDAARWLDGFFNRWYLDPLFRGAYPPDVIADKVALGHLAPGPLPFVQAGDMETISTPIDFLGVNYYSRGVVEAGPGGRPRDRKVASPDQLTDMGWEVWPQGLEDSLVEIHRAYAPKALFVTENGAAWDVPADADGRIRDHRRIEFMRDHLVAAHRAIGRGVPLRGYFAWSLLDNFEWAFGFGKKFGLHAVDLVTRERTAKDSAHWYRDVVNSNAVDVSPAPAREAPRASIY